MKISVVTLGCKVNQCESATIAAALDKLNIETSEGLQPADVYILNTCSVTAEADRKSRQHISKMIKLNPVKINLKQDAEEKLDSDEVADMLSKIFDDKIYLTN